MSIPPRKPMSVAPVNGTPILYYRGDDNHEEGPFIVAYCPFADGYNRIEDCGAAFFKMGEPDEFLVKLDGPGEWEPLPPDVEAWARQWFVWS